MKVAFIGDLHLNEWSDFARKVYVEGWDLRINSRLLEQYQVLEQIIEKLMETKVEVVFLLGDVFQSFTPATFFVFSEFMKKLIQLSKEVVVCCGNHDYIDEVEKLSYFSFLKDNFQFINKPKKLEIGGKLFGILPFHRVPEVLNHFTKKFLEEGVSILVTHNNLEGVLYRGIELRNGISKSLFSKFRYVFNGHYHEPQFLNLGSCKIINVGSIMDFTFADSDSVDKFILIYDMKNEKFERFYLKYKKFITVKDIEEAKKLKEDFYVKVEVKPSELKELEQVEGLRVKVKPERKQFKFLTLEEVLEQYTKEYKDEVLAKEFIFSLLQEVKG